MALLAMLVLGIVAMGMSIWMRDRPGDSSAKIGIEDEVAKKELDAQQPSDPDGGLAREKSSASKEQDGGSASEREDEPDPESKSRLAALFAAGEVTSVRLVGDSITAGFGTEGYPGDEAKSWANAFGAYAAEHGVASFVNAGVNGAFMQEFAADSEPWLGPGADVIFVAFGTNDAGYYGPGEYRNSARAGLSAAAQKSKLVVALSPVADLRPTSQLVEPAAELGDVLAEVCARDGYEFVDPRPYVTPDLFCGDGLHPNSEGSLAIWQCIRDTFGL